MGENPTVKIELPYDDALRLAYMAQFPACVQGEDQSIADIVTAAISAAEREYEENLREGAVR